MWALPILPVRPRDMKADFPQSERSESGQRWATELPRQKSWSFLLYTRRKCCWSLRPTMVHVGGEYTRVRIPKEKILVGCHGGWLPLQIKLCAHAKCSRRGRNRLCSHRIASPLRNFQACWFSFAVQNANGHFQSLTALRKKSVSWYYPQASEVPRQFYSLVKDLHWIIFTRTFFYLVSAWLNNG